jgi:hypothetical protein
MPAGASIRPVLKSCANRLQTKRQPVSAALLSVSVFIFCGKVFSLPLFHSLYYITFKTRKTAKKWPILAYKTQLFFGFVPKQHKSNNCRCFIYAAAAGSGRPM